MDVVYATGTFVAPLEGGGFIRVQQGSHWPADDPIVVGNPAGFSADPRFGLRYTAEPVGMDAPVEQATAAPGERRAVRHGGGSRSA